MGGGLINIVSYSSNDLFLTGSPQITFYKMVYRRYTNFAMESIFVDFENQLNFDRESELIPPKIADMIHKSYLHIEIRNINIIFICTHLTQYIYKKQIYETYDLIHTC